MKLSPKKKRVVLGCAIALAAPLFKAPANSTAAPVKSDSPTVEALLAAYDAIMGPHQFEATMQMDVTRANGDKRTYEMRMKKKGNDYFRIWFEKPNVVKGQEILRRKDQNFLWLPSTKRATAIAGRDDFQDGDFNNADVLRVNYTTDYSGVLEPSKEPGTYFLKLKAKNKDTAYDSIDLWVKKEGFQPHKAQFYGTSGKHMRTAVFSNIKDFGKGYKRPSIVVMRNEEVPQRSSQMTVLAMKTDLNIDDTTFSPGRLGK